MACQQCELLAKVKDAGARLAGVNKRGKGASITITGGGKSVTLTAADAKRLRDEAKNIRAACQHSTTERTS